MILEVLDSAPPPFRLRLLRMTRKERRWRSNPEDLAHWITGGNG